VGRKKRRGKDYQRWAFSCANISWENCICFCSSDVFSKLFSFPFRLSYFPLVKLERYVLSLPLPLLPLFLLLLFSFPSYYLFFLLFFSLSLSWFKRNCYNLHFNGVVDGWDKKREREKERERERLNPSPPIYQSTGLTTMSPGHVTRQRYVSTWLIE
jgi:hypothetical protein